MLSENSGKSSALVLSRERPGECPGDVFAHERRRVVGAGVERREGGCGRATIAKGHGNIAQPTFVADAADGAACQALFEFLFAPGEQVGERRGVQIVPDGEVGVADTGEAIPGAARLAIVASVDAVSDQRAQCGWDWSVQLYRQVGDAQARIDLVGCDDGRCRAGLDAAGAGAAMTFALKVRREIQRRIHLAEKVP